MTNAVDRELKELEALHDKVRRLRRKLAEVKELEQAPSPADREPDRSPTAHADPLSSQV